MSRFSSDFFVNNRARLRKLSQSPLIVVTANGLMQSKGDMTYPLRQDSNFWYLAGLNYPDLILVMAPNEEFLIVPAREVVMEQFDGARDYDELSRVSGVKQTVNDTEGWEKLTRLLKTHKKVATPQALDAYVPRYDFYSNPARAHLLQRMQSVVDLNIEDLRPTFATMRMVKQPQELAAIQEAIDITTDTLKEVATKGWEQFKYENQLEAALTHGFLMRGAKRHGFEPVVAAGVHTCTIHHFKNDGPIKAGQHLVLDVGAEVENYAADITRSVAVTKASKRLVVVHAAVRRVYDYAQTLLTPGTIIRSDYEIAIEKRMGEELKALGLIKKPSRKVIRHYFPHATSHHLGLEAHDAADYATPLVPNMVITIEPGIYIPEEGIGVRIEDDFLITKTHNKNISANLPLDLTWPTM